MRPYLLIAALSFAGWLGVLGALSQMMHWPRAAFVIVHYLLNIAVFGALFFFAASRDLLPSAGKTTLAAMLCLIVYEVIFFTWIYQSDRSFFTVVDWWIPAGLIAVAVWAAATYG